MDTSGMQTTSKAGLCAEVVPMRTSETMWWCESEVKEWEHRLGGRQTIFKTSCAS